MAKIGKKSKINDTVDGPDPGLFLDPRARVSRLKAYCAFRKLFRDDDFKRMTGLEWTHARPLIVPNLNRVVRWYWANHDHFARTTYVDMETELQRLKRHAHRLANSIEQLSPSTEAAINIIADRQPRIFEPSTAPIDHLRINLPLVDAACDRVLSLKERRKSPDHVQRVCEEFWKMWEALSKKPFKRTFIFVKTHEKYSDTRGKRQFTTDESLFVQIGLQAIDPNVEIATIRSGLKAVAAAKRSQSRSEN